MWSSRWEDALFNRSPERWTVNSTYPRIFSRQRWTYLLTDVEKERLAQRLRRGMRIVVFGLVFLTVPLAFWLPPFWLPDLVSQLVAGSTGAWLLFCLVVLVLMGVLVPAIFIAHFAWSSRYSVPQAGGDRSCSLRQPLMPVVW
jgi:polyferredoxin